NPPPVRSAEVTPQNRTIDRPSTPLITLDESTLPFLLLLALSQPCPGQLDHRRSQSRAHPSLPRAVTIPPSLTVALIGPRCQNLCQLCFGHLQNHFPYSSSQRFTQPIWS